MGSVEGMENFDVKSFWFILWHFNFHPFFQNLAFSLVIPASLYFDFHGLFSCWGVEVQTRKYDMTLSSRTHFYRHIKMFCIKAPPVKGFFVKLQKKRTDLERIKNLPLLSVWNVIIPFPLFCSGENLEPGIVTHAIFFFSLFLSGFHPILDALYTSEWGSRRLGYGIKI